MTQPQAQLVGVVEYTDFISAEGQDFLNECPAYDNKLSDCEASALDLWGMLSTSSLPLPLLPDPRWSGVVVPDRVI